MINFSFTAITQKVRNNAHLNIKSLAMVEKIYSFSVKLILLTGLVVLFCTNTSTAQNQIQLNFQALSPDFPSLNESDVKSSNHFSMQILNQSKNTGGVYKMRLTIQGNGIRMQTPRDVFIDPIRFNSSNSVVLFSSQIAPYFDLNNLAFSGYSKEKYLERGLPEGAYNVCFDLIDISGDGIAVASSKSCAPMWVRKHDPPEITYPADHDIFIQGNPVNFQWLPKHVSPNPVQYKLYVFDYQDKVTVNDLLTFYQPRIKKEVFTTQYLQAGDIGKLRRGRKYIAFVQAYGMFNNIDFKNGGYSAPVVFEMDAKTIAAVKTKATNPPPPTSCGPASGTVFINEISNGDNSNDGYSKEFVELVVAGTNSAGTVVDLTDWIIDDNNYNLVEVGNESGHIRLGPCFSAVPKGSIILIYNDFQGNLSPGIDPANDGVPNANGVYQIPISHACIKKHTGCPDFHASNTSYGCGETGLVKNPWKNLIPMRNTRDVLQVRSPDANLEHAILWNTTLYEYANSSKTIVMDPGTTAANRNFIFSAGEDWFDESNYSIVNYTTPTSTPGAPNNSVNSDLIDALQNNTTQNNFSISCQQEYLFNAIGATIEVFGTDPGTFFLVQEANGLIDDITTNQNPISINNLAEGSYEFMVTDQTTGCSAECIVDIVFNCQVGMPCDDLNPCTENDVLNADCECAGTDIEDIVFNTTPITAESCDYCGDYYPPYPAENFKIDYIKVELPDGTLKILDQSINADPGFDFPYCYDGTGMNNSILSCTNQETYGELIADLNGWISTNSYTGVVAMSSSICTTGISIVNSDLTFIEGGGFTDIGPHIFSFDQQNCTSQGNIIGYELSATINCDDPQFSWSNGSTSPTVTISSLDACFDVTVTCGVEDVGASPDIDLQDDFETAYFGIWIDGGSDAVPYNNAAHANSGTKGIRLRDDTNTSVITTQNLDASGIESISISFSYKTVSFEAGEDFWVQVSTDGGATYNTVQSFVRGTDFNNNERHDETVIVDGPFTETTRLRFRADANNNWDHLYLDDIIVFGAGNAGYSGNCSFTASYGSNCGCVVGAPCMATGCSTEGVYDEECNCSTSDYDSDDDTICDADDQCPGFDDLEDVDGDGIPDACDDDFDCEDEDDEITFDIVANGDDLCDYYICMDAPFPSGTDIFYESLIYETKDGVATMDIINDWQVHDETSFEIGQAWGIWNDGGFHSGRMNNSDFASDGNFSVWIRNNSTTSNVTTDALDFSKVMELKIDFNYTVLNFDNTERFEFQISTDGGTNYTTHKTWMFGDDFTHKSLEMGDAHVAGPFTANTKLRFRSYSNTNVERVHIDEVKIQVRRATEVLPANGTGTNNFVALLNNWMSSNGIQGTANVSPGSGNDCTGNILQVTNTDIAFQSISFWSETSLANISFESDDCPTGLPGQLNYDITANLDCTGATYEWSNGETGDSINVPSTLASFTVTVTCQNGCEYTASTDGVCEYGAPCTPDDCFLPPAFYNEFCECVGEPNLQDIDGDGIPDCEDDCPYIPNEDADGDGIDDCEYSMNCPANIAIGEQPSITTLCDECLDLSAINSLTLTNVVVNQSNNTIINLANQIGFTFPYCTQENGNPDCETYDPATLTYNAIPGFSNFISDFYSWGIANGNEAVQITVQDLPNASCANSSWSILFENFGFNSVEFQFGGASANSVDIPNSCEDIETGVVYTAYTQFCDNPQYLWSNGETTESITSPVTFAGYSVTVTCSGDDCEYVTETDDNLCIFGTPCDDLDDCTYNDTYNEYCDCVGIPNSPDSDNDGIYDQCDNCKTVYNPGQEDYNQNGIGDACDDCGVDSTDYRVCDYCAPLTNREWAHTFYDLSDLRYIDENGNPQTISWGTNPFDFANGYCGTFLPSQGNHCPGNMLTIYDFVDDLNKWFIINGYTTAYAEITDKSCKYTDSELSLYITGSPVQFVDLGFIYLTDGYGTFRFEEVNCRELSTGADRASDEHCDDGDICTENDYFNEDCECVGDLVDTDMDGVCNYYDQCEGFPDHLDLNDNGVPDGCDEDPVFTCKDGSEITFCEYMDNMLDCESTTDNKIRRTNLKELNSYLLDLFTQVNFEPEEQFIPMQLLFDLQQGNDADSDDIVDFLDPAPNSAANSSTGLHTVTQINNACNSLSLEKVVFLVEVMFHAVNDMGDDGLTTPECAAELGLDVEENEYGSLIDKTTGCRIEFTIDCDCKCYVEYKNDYDGDGDCDDQEDIGEPCTLTFISCQDNDPCTSHYIETNTSYDPFDPSTGPPCFCVQVDNADLPDADGDNVPDLCDECDGDDNVDSDNDGKPDDCDDCPNGIIGGVVIDDYGRCDNGNPAEYAVLVGCECVVQEIDCDGDGIPNWPDENGLIDCDDPEPCGDFSVDADGNYLCDNCHNIDENADADANGNGIPDCAEPPFYELDCPVDFFIDGSGDFPGMVVIYDAENLNINEIPNPVGLVMTFSASGADATYAYEDVPIENIRETEDGTYEVLYSIPDLTVNTNALIYAGIAYSDHQQCPLTTEGDAEPVDVICPTDITIVDGQVSLLMDYGDPNIPVDLLAFAGSYDFNLTGPGGNIMGTMDVDINQMFSLGNGVYQVALGDFPGLSGSFLDFNGSITLPSGTTCDYTAGSGLALPCSGEAPGAPCDPDMSVPNYECYHHWQLDANCNCVGELGVDGDGDGVCDQLDVCPGADDNLDVDGNGVPDGCECAQPGVDYTELVDGRDFYIFLDQATIDNEEFTMFTANASNGDPAFDVEITSANSPIVIPNLAYGFTYTVSISSVCTTGFPSDPITEVIDVPFGEDQFVCGLSLDLENISNYNGIASLNSGDIIEASDFNVVIRNASGGFGLFSGTGYIEIPYFDFVRINVSYENIYITEDYKMVNGCIIINGLGQNILGDDIINTLNDIMDILETVDDLLENLIDILEGIEELVETTGDYVDPTLVECVENATQALEDLANDPGATDQQVQQAQATLDACLEDYNAALALILDNLFIVMDGIFDELKTCDVSALESTYLIEKSEIETLVQTGSDNFEMTFPAGGTGLDETVWSESVEQVDVEDPEDLTGVDPFYLTTVEEFYTAENDYQFCTAIQALDVEITTVEQAKDLLLLVLEAGNDFVPIVADKIQEHTDASGNINIQTVIDETKGDFESFLRTLLIHKSYGLE